MVSLFPESKWISPTSARGHPHGAHWAGHIPGSGSTGRCADSLGQRGRNSAPVELGRWETSSAARGRGTGHLGGREAGWSAACLRRGQQLGQALDLSRYEACSRNEGGLSRAKPRPPNDFKAELGQGASGGPQKRPHLRRERSAGQGRRCPESGREAGGSRKGRGREGGGIQGGGGEKSSRSARKGQGGGRSGDGSQKR